MTNSGIERKGRVSAASDYANCYTLIRREIPAMQLRKRAIVTFTPLRPSHFSLAPRSLFHQRIQQAIHSQLEPRSLYQWQGPGF